MEVIESADTSNNDFYSSKFDCQIDYIDRCNGSALCSIVDTVVVVGVYGPGNQKTSKEKFDRVTVEIEVNKKSGLEGCLNRRLEKIIQQVTLASVLGSKYPRSLIHVAVQEMQGESAFMLAVALNATCFALLDSGCYMKYCFAALYFEVDTTLNKISLFPEKSSANNAKVTLVLAPGHAAVNSGGEDHGSYSIVSTFAEGSLGIGNLKECFHMAEKVCPHIFKLQEKVIQGKLEKFKLM